MTYKKTIPLDYNALTANQLKELIYYSQKTLFKRDIKTRCVYTRFRNIKYLK
jgi:uncharacterized protein (DUF433 family)